MSRHSYSRCWLHLVWTTLDREPMLTPPAAAKASRFLTEYALEKNIYMKINYFNPEHVHTLIDLPTNKSIEEVVQLLKGSSSHWINKNRLLEEDSHGDAVTERFRYRILMSIKSLRISLIKKSTIERRRSIRSLS